MYKAVNTIHLEEVRRFLGMSQWDLATYLCRSFLLFSSWVKLSLGTIQVEIMLRVAKDFNTISADMNGSEIKLAY